MKRTFPIASLVTLLLFPASFLSADDTAPRTRQPSDIRKMNDAQPAEIKVGVDVVFSGRSGVTVTDGNGTFYYFGGWCFFEPKVYPPEYWGVFPLYFFDDMVGVTVAVQNQSPDAKAEVRLRRECYCLRADGSSGGALVAPAHTDVAVDPAQTVTFDGSFVARYWADSESGLDRLLTKVHRPTSVDGNNGSHTIDGQININPNNSDQSEFVLRLPDGGVITRDDLTESHAGYNGPASSVHLKPKGNGNQNGMIVDGQTYQLKNGDTYDIVTDAMQVNLFNDHVDLSGKAMGHWWISVSAASATILVDEAVNPPLMVKEAVFCPPEYDAAVAGAVRVTLGE